VSSVGEGEEVANDVADVVNDLVGDRFPWLVLIARWSDYERSSPAPYDIASNIPKKDVVHHLEVLVAGMREEIEKGTFKE
jgi:hypothetical protein